MRPARLMGRVLVASGMVTAVVIVFASPVFAQTAKGDRDTSGISAGASAPGSSSSAQPVSTRRRSAPICTAGDGTQGPTNYRRVPTELLSQDEKDLASQQGGTYYFKFCGDESVPVTAGNSLETTFIPDRGAGAQPADPAALATDALERTPLPEPQITMAPAPDIPQLVNLATYLWLPADQWQPEIVSASAGGVTSTVTAMPTRVIWDMGQGDQVVCDGPGLPYDPSLSDEAQPSDCHYTYRRSSAGQPGQAYQVTATVEWETTWSVTGAAGGGSLGTATSSSTTSVQVAELQSLNVVPDQGA